MLALNTRKPWIVNFSRPLLTEKILGIYKFYTDYYSPFLVNKDMSRYFSPVPESLVVDDAHEDLCRHLDPVDPGVKGLRPVVVVPGVLQLPGVYVEINKMNQNCF